MSASTASTSSLIVSAKTTIAPDMCRLEQIPIERIDHIIFVRYSGRVSILRTGDAADLAVIRRRHKSLRHTVLTLQCGHWCSQQSNRDYVAIIVEVRQ